MKYKVTTCLFLIISISGCSSGVRPGTVAMKISDTEVHVDLGKQEIKPGDDLLIYRVDCSRKRLPCYKKVISEAKVTKLLNNHYSVATLPAPAGVTEGDHVEKK